MPAYLAEMVAAVVPLILVDHLVTQAQEAAQEMLGPEVGQAIQVLLVHQEVQHQLAGREVLALQAIQGLVVLPVRQVQQAIQAAQETQAIQHLLEPLTLRPIHYRVEQGVMLDWEAQAVLEELGVTLVTLEIREAQETQVALVTPETQETQGLLEALGLEEQAVMVAHPH